MTEKDEFFVPEEVDKQIEGASQSNEGDARDAEAMAYLRSYYQTDARQEQEALDRIWKRIAGAAFLEKTSLKEEKEQRPMQNIPIQSNGGMLNSSRSSRPQRSLRQRLGILVAAVLLIVLVGGITIVSYALRQANSGPTSPHPTGVISPEHGKLVVTAVDMSVTPGQIGNLACGTNVTVTYTALFHVKEDSAGGTVKFSYTVNNGRGDMPASITFKPGETSKAYTFTWSGALPADHTYPGRGGVQVTSPNQLTSALIAPTGQCTPAAAFQVTSVDMAVSPTSIQGIACGTPIVVTYTATIHLAPNGPGGTIQLGYTVNNGRGETPGSTTVSAGQTTKIYPFTWSGALPADHTYPGRGGVQVTSPNQLTSALVAPTGQCTPAVAFQVTSVDIAVSPTSIQGKACGTSIVVTYTATIHVAADGPGGTVQFYYTVNNGRGQTPASITFSAGQTTNTYSFTWSGALPVDHTYPEPGGIEVTSPNQLTSALVGPTGQCS